MPILFFFTIDFVIILIFSFIIPLLVTLRKRFSIRAIVISNIFTLLFISLNHRIYDSPISDSSNEYKITNIQYYPKRGVIFSYYKNNKNHVSKILFSDIKVKKSNKSFSYINEIKNFGILDSNYIYLDKKNYLMINKYKKQS